MALGGPSTHPQPPAPDAHVALLHDVVKIGSHPSRGKVGGGRRRSASPHGAQQPPEPRPAPHRTAPAEQPTAPRRAGPGEGPAAAPAPRPPSPTPAGPRCPRVGLEEQKAGGCVSWVCRGCVSPQRWPPPRGLSGAGLKVFCQPNVASSLLQGGSAGMNRIWPRPC